MGHNLKSNINLRKLMLNEWQEDQKIEIKVFHINFKCIYYHPTRINKK